MPICFKYGDKKMDGMKYLGCDGGTPTPSQTHRGHGQQTPYGLRSLPLQKHHQLTPDSHMCATVGLNSQQTRWWVCDIHKWKCEKTPTTSQCISHCQINRHHQSEMLSSLYEKKCDYSPFLSIKK
jgi:hypothetical protein